MKIEKQAFYVKGYRDAQAGVNRSACPYDVFSEADRWNAWQEGYGDALAEKMPSVEPVIRSVKQSHEEGN